MKERKKVRGGGKRLTDRLRGDVMDKNGGNDHQKFSVAEPGQVSANIVQEGVARLTADTHQKELNCEETKRIGGGGKHDIMVQVWRNSMRLSMNIEVMAIPMPRMARKSQSIS